MKKAVIMVTLVVLSVFSFGCGSGDSSSATQTTTSIATGATEATKKTSSVTISPTETDATGTVAAVEGPNVSVIAEKDTVAVGDTFEVVVVLDILDDLSHGVESALTWAPANLVECTDVADGEFFADFSTVHMGASGTAGVNNEQGTVDPIGQFCTGASEEEGGTGQGVIFIYYFTAVEAGEVTFSVPQDSLVVGNATGDNVIPIETCNDATVVIEKSLNK